MAGGEIMIQKRNVPDIELMEPGHLACPGCGAPLAMRFALKALGPKTIVIIPACCWSIIAGPFPMSSLKVPMMHVAFETAAATASGVKAALEVKGDNETIVMAWAGDGGTFDIGFQALSGAAERNENFIYVCYDNEAYMNTGIQRSSATPWGAWTTTTPYEHPEESPKKDIDEIMASHNIPYVATCTPAYPEDMIAKFKKAKNFKGLKFIHVLSPCPPGWKMQDEISLRVARLAVKSRVFPLYEIYDGIYYNLTLNPEYVPIIEYLKFQARFRHLSNQQVKFFENIVQQKWERLLYKIEMSKKYEDKYKKFVNIK